MSHTTVAWKFKINSQFKEQMLLLTRRKKNEPILHQTEISLNLFYKEPKTHLSPTKTNNIMSQFVQYETLLLHLQFAFFCFVLPLLGLF